jgi:hypothetical protein
MHKKEENGNNMAESMDLETKGSEGNMRVEGAIST